MHCRFYGALAGIVSLAEMRCSKGRRYWHEVVSTPTTPRTPLSSTLLKDKNSRFAILTGAAGQCTAPCDLEHGMS